MIYVKKIYNLSAKTHFCATNRLEMSSTLQSLKCCQGVFLVMTTIAFIPMECVLSMNTVS